MREVEFEFLDQNRPAKEGITVRSSFKQSNLMQTTMSKLNNRQSYDTENKGIKIKMKSFNTTIV